MIHLSAFNESLEVSLWGLS